MFKESTIKCNIPNNTCKNCSFDIAKFNFSLGLLLTLAWSYPVPTCGQSTHARQTRCRYPL